MTPAPDTTLEPTEVRLSVVIITRNEAHNLPRLLASVTGIADEIVVFDSGSTDGTVAVAKQAGAKVSSCEWTGWSDTKNRANQAASGTWILSLDADEALTRASADAIRMFVDGPVRSESGAWRVGEINRLTRYVDQWVRHSGWHPDRKIRLWPKGAGHWKGDIHEALVFDGNTEVERIAGVVEHHSYPTVASHLHQIERFGAVWAESQFQAGRSSTVALACIKVMAQWFKTALLKGGFRDGPTGWAIAKRSAWATWRKHARLRMLHRPLPPPRRVLVARTDALGDLICTLPLVAALLERHPGVEVDLLVRPYAAPVAACAIGVRKVVEWTEDCAQDTRQGSAALRAEKYDAIVHAFPDPAVLRAAQSAGIPIRIGTGRRRHALTRLTHRNWDSRRQSGGHEAWHGLRLLMPLGVDVRDLHPSATSLTPPPASDNVAQWLQRLGPQFLLIHPGSHGSAGNAKPSDFAQLALSFAESGMTVGITGTASEGHAFEPALPDHPRVCSLFGALDLEELLALQSHAALVVASSTGPLHTASAMGIPVLGLYHSEAPAWPQRWAPIGPAARVFVTDRRTPSGHLELDVAQVIAAAERAMSTSG